MSNKPMASHDAAASTAARRKSRRDGAFFVGYLPMPVALTKFYWPLTLLLLVACGFAGYWLAAAQKPTGPAIWQPTTTTMQGVLTLKPYPVLHRIATAGKSGESGGKSSESGGKSGESGGKSGESGGWESILLVGQGKHAAAAITARLDGQMVAITGRLIQRGRWRMLEIADMDADVAPIDATPLAPPAVTALGAIDLRGEIVDSKCFLGVMKPGAGGVHKACAEVCLRGGIPPILVAADAQNQHFGYLLTRADGESAATWLATFAAITVRASGQLQQLGDLLFIKLDENGVSRI